MKPFGERFNYFDDWSQEMFYNDTHLVPVVLCGDLLPAGMSSSSYNISEISKAILTHIIFFRNFL